MVHKQPNSLSVIILGLLLIFFLAFADFPKSALAQTSQRANDNSPLGTNLAGIAYYSTENPFVDVMKTSSPWVTSTVMIFDTLEENKLDLDQDGWVRSLTPIGGQTATYTMVQKQIRSYGTPTYPSNRMIVLYDGEGTILYKSGTKNNSLSTPGRDVVDVATPNGVFFLLITATDPNRMGNYIRNIRVVRESQESLLQSGEIFNPEFVDKIKKYQTLRFMDWMATNYNNQSAWSSRPKESDATYGTLNPAKGVPVEVMIKLANKLHADPWFNVPHRADDNYVQNFAQLVKDQLDPSLKVYVEYSNEVWNGIFPQSRYAISQGAAQTPPIDSMQYHALRTRQIGDIFKGVLGESRVVTVLGAQAANTWTATHGLDYLNTRFGTHGIDAVAIAPYMGVIATQSTMGTYTAMTLDQLFDYVRTTVLPRTITFMNKYRTAANNYGVQLVAYEGGQHLVGIQGAENNDALNNLFWAFNRDSRINQLYTDYLNSWKQAGGELFVHFIDVGSFSKWGSWGSMEYLNSTSHPKYDALMSFIDNNPCWWANCGVDTTPPSQVTGLAASSTTTSSTTLAWSPATDNIGVVAYLVYRDGVNIANVSSLSCVAAGLSPSTTYSFTVRAKDAAGNLGVMSSSLSVRTLDQAAPQPSTNDNSPLGINLESTTYWNPANIFINVFKSSNAWATSNNSVSNTGEQDKLDLDENGWVKSLTPKSGQTASYTKVSALMLNQFPAPYYPAGQYIVTYDGEGTINYGSDARNKKNVALSRPGRDVLDINTPTQAGLSLEITATDPNRNGNYIRNIRVFRADQESLLASGEIFNPDWLERFKKFRVLRFMNPMRATGSTECCWSARAKETDASYGTLIPQKGWPVEVMVKLANKLHADPWFSIPHLADDNYVQNFAQVVRDQLDPSLKVYVEYSNEVWNGAFTENAYVVSQGAAQNPPIDGIQYHALRTRQIGDIFKSVLGNSRVVTTLGAQAANTWTATRGLDYLNTRFGTHGIDAVAIAPYFGFIVTPATADTYTAMSVDQLFDYVRTSSSLGAIPGVITSMNTYTAKMNSYGVDLIAYEGGQHMVGARGAERNDALNNLFWAFNRDIKIKQLYLDYLKIWKDSGGKLFVYYTDVTSQGIFGSWGALENVLHTSSPKYDALISFIDNNPCWWANCSRAAITTPPCPKTTITSQTSTSGTVGSAFSYTITATENPTGFTATNLPNGLSISGNSISGTPTGAGTTEVTITATNRCGSANKTLVISIAALRSDGPIVVLNASRTSGVAPLSVFFDASSTTDADVTRPFHELDYKWSFGDSGSGDWTYGSGGGGNSKNIAYGPEAAHVFENPGTYTVNLDVFDGVTTSSRSVRITVQDPNSVFSGTNTICFSSNSLPTAGSGGCPSGSDVKRESDFAAIINTYAKPGKRLLLKRGDTFTGTTETVLNSAGPGIIGAYGTGEKPVIHSSMTSTGPFSVFLLNIRTTLNDWRLMDLEVDGRFDTNLSGISFGVGNFNQVLFYRLYVHDISGGIALSMGQTFTSIPDQISMVDTTINHMDAGTYGSHMASYWAATRLSLMGNFINDTLSGESEHLMRIQYTNKAVVSHNTLQNAHDTKEMLAIRAVCINSSDSCVAAYFPQLGLIGEDAATQRIVISDNEIRTNTYAGVDIDGGVNKIFKDFILERNYYYSAGGGGAIVSGASEVTIRNEIIDQSNAATSQAISIEGILQDRNAGSNNVWIYSNTIYSNSTRGFTGVYLAAGISNITIMNNLAYAPNSPANTGKMYTNQGISNLIVSNNSNNSQIKSSFPNFTSSTPSTHSDFMLTLGSYAINTGTSVPAYRDFDGKLRPINGAWDLGAFEFGDIANVTPSAPESPRSSGDGGSGGGGGGGGGGSGGGGTVLTDKSTSLTIVITRINKNEDKNINVNSEAIALTSISLKPKRALSNVEFSIIKLKSRPAAISLAPAPRVFQYLDIAANNVLDSSISLSFCVSLSWVEENAIDISTIALYRFTDGAWQKLPTIMVSKDGQNLYFAAQTPGFSLFAIGGQPQPGQTSQALPEEALLIPPLEDSTTTDQTLVEGVKKNLYFLNKMFLFLLPVIFISVVIIVIVMRRRRRYMPPSIPPRTPP